MSEDDSIEFTEQELVYLQGTKEDLMTHFGLKDDRDPALSHWRDMLGTGWFTFFERDTTKEERKEDIFEGLSTITKVLDKIDYTENADGEETPRIEGSRPGIEISDPLYAALGIYPEDEFENHRGNVEAGKGPRPGFEQIPRFEDDRRRGPLFDSVSDYREVKESIDEEELTEALQILQDEADEVEWRYGRMGIPKVTLEEDILGDIGQNYEDVLALLEENEIIVDGSGENKYGIGSRVYLDKQDTPYEDDHSVEFRRPSKVPQ